MFAQVLYDWLVTTVAIQSLLYWKKQPHSSKYMKRYKRGLFQIITITLDELKTSLTIIKGRINVHTPRRQPFHFLSFSCGFSLEMCHV